MDLGLQGINKILNKMAKTLKFNPHATELIKNGEQTATLRLFDDKNFTTKDIGATLILATRVGDKVVNFGEAIITSLEVRTIATLKPKDFLGHEFIPDPLNHYRIYYGEKVRKNSDVKIIRFKVTKLY